ncbi:MAG TPA: ribonuclease P protein component [Lysobacter sp.]|nr:ribonuclease P protein component [Lysobacter sp.]
MLRALCRREIESLLGTRPLAKTDHFVLHWRAAAAVVRELSTENAPSRNDSVDIKPTPDQPGLASVVPKRHARRAATRNLIKRQVRELWRRQPPMLRTGQALVRLRAPFDVSVFPSAASPELRAAVRADLEALIARWAPAPCR